MKHYWVYKTQSSLVFAEASGTGGTAGVSCSLSAVHSNPLMGSVTAAPVAGFSAGSSA